MKDIKGFEGKYAATKNGRIWSHRKLSGRAFKNGHFMAIAKNRKGYSYVQLPHRTKFGKRSLYLVHRLVGQAFIPNPENKPQINHKNGIKTDNRLKNLEWNTHKQNMAHAVKNGLSTRGTRNGRTKLTEKQVLQIRKEYSKGKTQAELSKKYKVVKSNIKFIISRQHWKHI